MYQSPEFILSWAMPMNRGNPYNSTASLVHEQRTSNAKCISACNQIRHTSLSDRTGSNAFGCKSDLFSRPSYKVADWNVGARVYLPNLHRTVEHKPPNAVYICKMKHKISKKHENLGCNNQHNLLANKLMLLVVVKLSSIVIRTLRYKISLLLYM